MIRQVYRCRHCGTRIVFVTGRHRGGQEYAKWLHAAFRMLPRDHNAEPAEDEGNAATKNEVPRSDG